MLVWAAALYNYAEVSLSWLLDTARRVVAAWEALVQPADYIFFEGSTTPHPIRSTAYYATGSAAPELIYCADTKTFYPFVPHTPVEAIKTTTTHRMACPTILSIELVDAENRVAYDLTDFLEGVRFAEVEGYPAPNLYHYLSAWSLSSHVIPDYNRLGVRYIDTNGDTHVEAEENDEAAEAAAEAAAEEAVTEEVVAALIELSRAAEEQTPPVAEAAAEPAAEATAVNA
jgi:hypothetical protein